MPAFPSLSDADRWDLAFHVPALRHGATPPERALELPLAELSTRSDAEIEASLAREGVAPSRRAGALAHLRVEAPYDAEPAAPPSPSSDVAVRGALAFALLAAAAYLLAGRRGRGVDGASSKGAFTGRALALLGAACALALGVAFGGGAALRAARSPSSPFAWTVHLVAPEPVRRGTAHLVFEGDERMARFDARNDARFDDLPAAYRARTPRLVVQTAPEMEPSWSPQRRFSLRRSTLEVHARPERARFGVVALYRSERSPEPQIARAERFNLGDDDLPAGVLVDRATLGLRVLASDLPASSRFVATPGASPRWLRPSVPFDHVDERETLIVLVDRALWDELGDAPEPYVVRARAAIAAP
jgi:hypothetical protein